MLRFIGDEIIKAVRRILRRPASAAGIVLALALGLGICTSMFAVLNGVALRALPYPDADRIVRIHSEHAGRGLFRGLSPAEAVEGLPDAPGFEQTAYAQTFVGTTVVGEDGRPLEMPIMGVSRGYFSVFGVQPALGRPFAESDFGAPSVGMLSHAAWQMLGGSDDVVGQSVRWDPSTIEIVGVLPPWSEPSGAPRLYLPFDGQHRVGEASRIFQAFGRLTRGASSDDLAEEGLRTRFAAVNEQYGQSEDGWRPVTTRLLDEVVGSVRGVLLALFAISLLVLLTACSTTASLVSIRLEQRKRELAVRLALGASRRRVVADVGVELLLLAGLAALTGIWLAYAATAAIEPLAEGSLPRAAGIGIGGVSLAFAVGAAMIAIAVSAVLPVVRSLSIDPASNLQGSPREVEGGRRISWLPAASIALSTVAVLVALALSVSLMRLGEVEPGIRSDGINAVALVRTGNVDRFAFLDRVLESARSIPGVGDAVAVMAGAPTAAQMLNGEFLVNGERLRSSIQAASAGYHRFFGIPLLRGRDIEERDRAGAPRVVVINETLARQAFGGVDPIGHFVSLPLFGEDLPHEIIGMAADRRNAGLHAPTQPEIVQSLHQWDAAAMTLLVDWPNAPAGWRSIIEQIVWEIDPSQPVAGSFTLNEQIEAQFRPLRFFATATGWFAVLALLLCAIGVNAVIAAMQRRRRREIGLRMALGAAPHHAGVLVLGAAARLLAIGLVTGIGLAIPGLRLFRDRLFEVEGSALWAVLGATALVLIVSGILAVSWPVWRASRIEPMSVLRGG